MTIEGLGSIIDDKIPNAKKYLNFNMFNRKRVAIDADNWIYKYFSVAHASVADATPIEQMLDIRTSGPIVDPNAVQQKWLTLMLDAICLWLSNQTTPVFVFDGPTHTEKLETTSGRQQQRDKDLVKFETIKREYLSQPPLLRADNLVLELKKIARRIFEIGTNKIAFRSILNAIGIPCLTAKHDSEELCAYLAQKQARAALTKDKDALAWGCPLMLLDTPQRTVDGEGQVSFLVESLELRDVLFGLRMDFSQFVDFCIMCGTDFNERLTQLGPARALPLIERFQRIDKIPLIPGTNQIDRGKINVKLPDTHTNAKTKEKIILTYDLAPLKVEQTRAIFAQRKPEDAILDGILPPLKVQKHWSSSSQDVLSLYGIDRYREQIFNLVSNMQDPEDNPIQDPTKAHLPRMILKPKALPL